MDRGKGGGTARGWVPENLLNFQNPVVTDVAHKLLIAPLDILMLSSYMVQ